MRNKQRILIFDSHIGATLSHKKLFEEAGFEVTTFYIGIAQLYKIHPLYDLYTDKKQSFTTPEWQYLGVIKEHGIKVAFECFILLYLGNIERLIATLFCSKYRDFMLKHSPFLQHFFRIISFNKIDFYNVVFSRLFPTHSNGFADLSNNKALRILLNDPNIKRIFENTDYLMCSYPPKQIFMLRIFAEKFNKKIIFNLGHRFDQSLADNNQYEYLSKNLVALAKDPQNVVGVASPYDYHYTKYYLNLSLNKTYLKTFQVNLSKKKINDVSRTILIGPSRNLFGGHHHWYKQKMLHFKDTLNNAYKTFCKQNAVVPTFTFAHILDLFPYGYDDCSQLAEYFGVIILPYSSFSISGLELYELNIPYFYPSKEYVITHLMPSKRIPSEFTGYRADAPLGEFAESNHSPGGEYKTAPHSFSKEARDEWCSYFSGYQHKNSIIFNDTNDLVQKIMFAEKDFNNISEKMFAENKKERELLVEQWQTLLN